MRKNGFWGALGQFWVLFGHIQKGGGGRESIVGSHFNGMLYTSFIVTIRKRGSSR